MVIKAQSPAGFAEEYIIESIWNNRFPRVHSPAERELSELMGHPHHLREVLQRLARDGWLTIQHGKPTKVNNFWETSGLNILETLARLDHESVPQLIDNLLSVRTNISTIFIRTAFRQHPDNALAVLASAREVEDHADAFADPRLQHLPRSGVCLRQPDLRPDPQRHERAVHPHRPPLFRQPGSAAWRWASIISWRKCAKKVCTIRFMRRCVATVTTAARSGTGCRKRCRVI
jgi:GntR family negative regulator for fad regulon and positive regulator of fabA